MTGYLPMLLLCAAMFAFGLFVCRRPETAVRWRFRRYVADVDNVVTDHAITVHRVGGVIMMSVAVVVAVGLASIGIGDHLDDRRWADMDRMFGVDQVELADMSTVDEIHTTTMMPIATGPHYFEGTAERLEALAESATRQQRLDLDGTDLLVPVSLTAEWVEVGANAEQVTITTGGKCHAANWSDDADPCPDHGRYDPPVSSLRLLPIRLDAPIGDRQIIDGATGTPIPQF